jgi:hypothetical protein
MRDKHRGIQYYVSGNLVFLGTAAAADWYADDLRRDKPKLCWLGGPTGKTHQKAASHEERA